METKTFTTPLRKLARFFEKSRDGWKEKYQQAKQQCKQLSNQARAVEKSRDHWKELVRQQEQEIRELRQQLSEDKNASAGTGSAWARRSPGA
jgi:predicted  nucleic acid-binding Zn-ribbon protein